MKTEEKKTYFLSRLFKHLDGVAMTPTIMALKDKKILSYLWVNHDTYLTKIASKYNANIAYLNVALRMLASQGYLQQKINHKKHDVKFIAPTSDSILPKKDWPCSQNFHSRQFLDLHYRLRLPLDS